MPGYVRAYTHGEPSRYHADRIRAENARRRAVANRCTGRRKSTINNPLPHVYKDVGGDVMGCKHCPVVRQLTNAEYRAKYGVDRPSPLPTKKRCTLPLWPLPALIVGVIAWSGQVQHSAAPVIAAGVGMIVVVVLWARR